MRGEASRISDRVSRDELAPKLRSTGKDAWRIGNELFTITNVLDHTVQLERALTDPSRPVDDKIGVLKELIGAQAHPMTLGIMSDLVGRKWSRAAHIANAVEDFGVDAMMYYADATGVTLRVSVELAELHSALLNLPVLRSKLNDDSVPAKARIDLLNAVLGKTEFTRHMGESMITVTTASPLNIDQIKRLTDVYSAKLDHPVHINSVVDPTVLGGMRIQVGDEVTDNTVVAQLQQLQRTVRAKA